MCAPSKYYSYLQAGKPILTIVEEETYLAREITEDENGCFSPIGDRSGIVNQISELQKNPDMVKRMSVRSENLYTEKYAFPICMGKYLDLFRGLAEGE